MIWPQTNVIEMATDAISSGWRVNFSKRVAHPFAIGTADVVLLVDSSFVFDCGRGAMFPVPVIHKFVTNQKTKRLGTMTTNPEQKSSIGSSDCTNEVSTKEMKHRNTPKPQNPKTPKPQNPKTPEWHKLI